MNNNPRPANGPSKTAILLVAKSAFAASPHQAMQRLVDLVASSRPGVLVRFAFTEQGAPSLHEALSALLDEDLNEIVIVPLVLPMELSFHIWLKKSLTRWKSSDDRPWPGLSIAKDIASSALMGHLLNDLLETADELRRPLLTRLPPKAPSFPRKSIGCWSAKAAPATRPAQTQSGGICATSRNAASYASPVTAR